MQTIDIVISNKLGLHARAAAKLTQLASKYESEIFINRADQRVNAKSIMGVMMLAAGKGVTVTLDAEGVDAKEALSAIEALFDDKFGEGEYRLEDREFIWRVMPSAKLCFCLEEKESPKGWLSVEPLLWMRLI